MSFDNPFGGSASSPKIICPVCKADEFDARQNQYETWRECRKCGNRWSGGSVGAGQPDFALVENMGLVPPEGVPAPDDDLPSSQYTGSPFRDPSRNFGGDE